MCGNYQISSPKSPYVDGFQDIYNWTQEKSTLNDDEDKCVRFKSPFKVTIEFKIDNSTLCVHFSLADKNLIKPVLAKTLPFTAEAVQEGFDLLKSRRAVGKIVFEMEASTS